MAKPAAAPGARRALYSLFVANAISMAGNQLAALAIPWFVLETTGSAAQTGITAFFSVLPIVIAAFFGGALVDRMGFKRSSVVADLASGLAVMLVPLLFAMGLLEFWVLLVLVFLGALLDAPGTTAREAMLPDLAEAAGMPMERASSLLQVVERGARLIGAPVGGLLIAALGAQNVLWLNALTFAISALLVALTVPTVAPVRGEGTGNYLGELLEGLRFIRRERLIFALTLTLLITNLLDAAKGSVLMPVFAREAYGSATAMGLLFGVSGGGAVLGALVYSAVTERVSRQKVFAAAFIVASLPMLLFATLPPLGVALLVQAAGGLAAGPLNPILYTLEFERIPAALRGRVFGTITAGAFAAMPLGVVGAGFLVEAVGLQWSFALAGSCYLLTTLSLLVNPALRNMDERAGAGLAPARVLAEDG